MSTAQANSYHQKANLRWSSNTASLPGIHEVDEPFDEPSFRTCRGARMAVFVLEPTILAEAWLPRLGESSALLTNLGQFSAGMPYEAIDLHGLTPVLSLEGDEPDPMVLGCHPTARLRIRAKVTVRRGRLSYVAPSILEEA